MTFYKSKRNTNSFKKEDQLEWKNTTHEVKFNPFKNYYSIIKIGNQSFVEEYEGKYRTEAKEYFNEFARINGGKVDYFGVLK